MPSQRIEPLLKGRNLRFIVAATGAQNRDMSCGGRLLSNCGERLRSHTAEKRYELAPSHSRPRALDNGIVATVRSIQKGAATMARNVCFWVKSRHVQYNRPCPLYPRRWTFCDAEPMSFTASSPFTLMTKHREDDGHECHKGQDGINGV